jgi:HEAT repeat protein
MKTKDREAFKGNYSVGLMKLLNAFDQEGESAPLAAIMASPRGDPEYTRALIDAAASHPRTRVRRWAVEALGIIGIGDANLLGPICKSLSDNQMSVRLHAIKALVHMNASNRVEELRPLLADTSGGIRVNAILAAISLQGSSLCNALEICLGDEKWYVRQRAADALGYLGTVSNIPSLGKCFDDPRKAVSKAAREAVEKIQARCS